eukprot:2298322-Alexandrium_andersonii.AAC.1
MGGHTQRREHWGYARGLRASACSPTAPPAWHTSEFHASMSGTHASGTYSSVVPTTKLWNPCATPQLRRGPWLLH